MRSVSYVIFCLCVCLAMYGGSSWLVLLRMPCFWSPGNLSRTQGDTACPQKKSPRIPEKSWDKSVGRWIIKCVQRWRKPRSSVERTQHFSQICCCNCISWLFQNPTSALWSRILKLDPNKTSLKMVFIDLFVVYLTMLSVAETGLIWRSMIGWELNTKFEKMCKEAVLAWFEVLSQNFPWRDWGRIWTILSQDSCFSYKIWSLELMNTK
jgi:hypothetical protein